MTFWLIGKIILRQIFTKQQTRNVRLIAMLFPTSRVKTITILSSMILSCSLSLAGCRDEQSLENLCQQQQNLCQQLVADPRCNNSRREVLATALQLQLNPSAQQQFKQLGNLETYLQCAEKAALIQNIDPTQRQALRSRDKPRTLSAKQLEDRQRYAQRLQQSQHARQHSFLYAKEMFDQLERDTRASQDPHLLYWHWSRNNDHNAIDQLLKMDQQGLLSDYDLAFFISQEYVRYDQDKAKQALLRSLRHYPKDQYARGAQMMRLGHPSRKSDSIHVQVFRGLTSLFFAEKKYANAYVFAKLLTINKDISVDETQALLSVLEQQSADVDSLEDIAWKIHAMLENDSFDPSILPELI